ncbi:MAG: hypothetical protein KBF88_01885 [Polyangiaceae bacterium]|nr:hypothetical protein [Polyangiaceae bacterium]
MKETNKSPFLSRTKYFVASALGAVVMLACGSESALCFSEECANTSSLPQFACDDGTIVSNMDECIGRGSSGGSCAKKTYEGFGAPLEVGEGADEAGKNRLRFKPFDALLGEMSRVIGVRPASISTQGEAFGQEPPRWLREPRASAISLVTFYNAAFDGCKQYVATPAEFAALPTDASADAQCNALAKRFWSRSPSPEEMAACKTFALTKSAKETDPRRRWAYVCASVLSSAGFLTY